MYNKQWTCLEIYSSLTQKTNYRFTTISISMTFLQFEQKVFNGQQTSQQVLKLIVFTDTGLNKMQTQM